MLSNIPFGEVVSSSGRWSFGGEIGNKASKSIGVSRKYGQCFTCIDLSIENEEGIQKIYLQRDVSSVINVSSILKKRKENFHMQILQFIRWNASPLVPHLSSDVHVKQYLDGFYGNQSLFCVTFLHDKYTPTSEFDVQDSLERVALSLQTKVIEIFCLHYFIIIYVHFIVSLFSKMIRCDF